MPSLPIVTSVQLAAALERRGYVCTLYEDCLRLERPSDGRILVIHDAGLIPEEKLAVLLAAAAVGVDELVMALRYVKHRSGQHAVVRPEEEEAGPDAGRSTRRLA